MIITKAAACRNETRVRQCSIRKSPMGKLWCPQATPPPPPPGGVLRCVLCAWVLALSCPGPPPPSFLYNAGGACDIFLDFTAQLRHPPTQIWAHLGVWIDAVLHHAGAQTVGCGMLTSSWLRKKHGTPIDGMWLALRKNEEFHHPRWHNLQRTRLDKAGGR